MAKVDTLHPSYKNQQAMWRKARLAMEGEEAVKASGEEYLPRLDTQYHQRGPDPYDAYIGRALFLEASKRTRDGLVGAILRKMPTIQAPDDVLDALKTIGSGREHINSLFKTALDEDVGIGRVGHLFDASSTVVIGTGQPRPYIVEYYGENIINWDTETINGVETPVMWVLKEKRKVLTDDRFVIEWEDQYRVLRLGFEGAFFRDADDVAQLRDGITFADIEQPFYWQEIWIKNPDQTSQEKFVLDRVIIPRMPGGRLYREIPFEITNAENKKIDPCRPPLMAVVNLNFSHYKNSADLEHGRHFTALPTAWAAGFSIDGDLTIGSGVAWKSDEPTAKAGYLEFSGAGLGHIADGMRDKEKLMAAVGARLLEEQPSQVEAAASLRLRQGGERSVLANIAIAVSQSFTNLVKRLATWMGKDQSVVDKIRVEFNEDFNTDGIPSDQLTALMAAVQGGLLSWKTWFYNVKRGEIIPDGVNEEEEALLIADGLPAGVSITAEEETPEEEEKPENEEPEEKKEEE